MTQEFYILNIIDVVTKKTSVKAVHFTHSHVENFPSGPMSLQRTYTQNRITEVFVKVFVLAPHSFYCLLSMVQMRKLKHRFT